MLKDIIKQKIFWTRKIFQSTHNPLKVFLFRIGVFKECECNFKQFGTVKLYKKDVNNGLFPALITIGSVPNNPNGINFIKKIIAQKDEYIINLESLKILNVGISSFIETFVEEQYKLKQTNKNKVVIDIGGNVGDTALYFAKKGYEVYSFEPVPDVFNIALKNLELNPELESKIHFINKAVSCKKGTLKIAFQGLNESGQSSTYLSSDEYCEVEATTIKDILNEYDFKPYVLKMDCEGCEYDIIQNTDLSMFNEIIFEYHAFLTGIDVEILINKLINQGFRIKKKDLNFPDMGLGIGLIYAYK